MIYNFNNKLVLRTANNPYVSSITLQELKDFFNQRKNKEALFLASPDLLEEFTKWCEKGIKNTEDESGLISSLLKYAYRMNVRCTPFGLFAGCAVVNFGESNHDDNIVICSNNIVRKTRLDMNFSCALSEKLSKLPLIQKHLKFYPNNSLYSLQDKIRYVDYSYINGRRIHQISAVTNSLYLNRILNLAKDGMNLEKLSYSIIDDEINRQDAFDFVNEIVKTQLLVSELEPAVTGEELLSRIVSIVNNIVRNSSDVELKSILDLITKIKNELDKIDRFNVNDIEVYEQLAKELNKFDIEIDRSKLFQVDLSFNTQNDFCLNKNVKNDLSRALDVINKLTPKPKKTYLSTFKERFLKRYENKQVSILEVLDIETGIGYANSSDGILNSLIDDIELPHTNKVKSEISWNERQRFLFKKLIKAQNEAKFSIGIQINELNNFETDWTDLSDSFTIQFKHLGKRNGRDFLSLKGSGGSSAISMLGRFASSNQNISEIVYEIAKNEEKINTNVLLAEIVHLPESRIGNVLMRPSFRQYEIPYLSKSNLPLSQQIDLRDLYVSIERGRVILFSKKLNKEIKPLMGNAHNYSSNSLPVYHFLCDLQYQNKRSSLFFDWGSLKYEFSFLPRVEVDNVVISFATWQLKKEDYQVLLDEKLLLGRELIAWKEKFKLPDLILLVEGDNELLVNLKDELSLKMFISILKKKSNVILKEFVFDEKTSIVRDENGKPQTNEFIAILEKNKAERNDQLNKSYDLNIKHGDLFLHQFSLGSEWLYYKLYCGVKTMETILIDVIKPLTQELIESNILGSWFFIRYADPEMHIRIRFHLKDMANLGKVIQLFQVALAKYEHSGLIWKIQTDTYNREIERYGSNSILLAELIFYHDSEFILQTLDLLNKKQGSEYRWKIAISATNRLLSDFEYSDINKRDLLKFLKTQFAKEFGMNKGLKMQIDKKYRKNRKVITDILSGGNVELSLFDKLLDEKSQNTKPFVKKLLLLHRNNELQMTLNVLLASYIHMLFNRLFKSKQRMHEMVIYDFMWRTYHSEIAKERQLNKQY